MISRLLVIGQFTCIAVLLFGGPWILPWWSWIVFGAGLVLFGWAVVALGAANFTIMPEPRQTNALSVRGIYRFLRHPMYTAVLLCGVAVACGGPSLWRWVALLLCLPILVFKIRHEEGLLTRRYPDYPQRMHSVARLLPGVW